MRKSICLLFGKCGGNIIALAHNPLRNLMLPGMPENELCQRESAFPWGLTGSVAFFWGQSYHRDKKHVGALQLPAVRKRGASRLFASLI